MASVGLDGLEGNTVQPQPVGDAAHSFLSNDNIDFYNYEAEKC